MELAPDPRMEAAAGDGRRRPGPEKGAIRCHGWVAAIRAERRTPPDHAVSKGPPLPPTPWAAGEGRGQRLASEAAGRDGR